MQAPCCEHGKVERGLNCDLCKSDRPDNYNHPNSMWLVVVEARHEVIRVCASGNGFYIPGQEPCWDFSHIQEWIKQVLPY